MPTFRRFLAFALVAAGLSLAAGVPLTRANPVAQQEDRFEEVAALPDDYIGVWKGTGSQDDPPAEWSILIALTRGDIGETVGTIAYPSIGCGGELTLKQVNPDTIVVIEHMTYGNLCTPRGRVTLERVGDSALEYAWDSENYDITATGMLSRISGK
jgi:hypothetical protein